MQKLIGSALVAMFLTFGGMGTAWSVPFIDTVDPNPDVELKSMNKTYDFTHDIMNDGFNPSSYTITVQYRSEILRRQQRRLVEFTARNSTFHIRRVVLWLSGNQYRDEPILIATQLLQSDGKIKVLLTLVDNFFGDYGMSTSISQH